VCFEVLFELFCRWIVENDIEKDMDKAAITEKADGNGLGGKHVPQKDREQASFMRYPTLLCCTAMSALNEAE